MATDGNRTTHLTSSHLFDELLGNLGGSVVRVPADNIISAVTARVGPNWELRSQLYGDLAWNDGAIGTVWGDPDESRRGTYRKSGNYLAGSWTRIGPLPPSSIADARLQMVIESLESLIAGLGLGMRAKGNWSPASGAFPSGASQGDMWAASAAGTVGGQAWAIGDLLVAAKDAPSTTTFANNWMRIGRQAESTRYCDTIAALRAVPKSAGSMTVRGYTAAGDGGGGHFFVKDQVASKAEVPGLYIVGADGAGWQRTWDGQNFDAAWVGCTPAVADIGPHFALFPKYATIHFQSGKYIVATYPTEEQFSDKLYRGNSVIWNCTGTLGADDPAFHWHYGPSQAMGLDGAGNNNNDMINAGISPIEGIGIVSALGTSYGIGFKISNTSGVGNNYFLRPKNFSVGGFRVGFMSGSPNRNYFLTGLDDCVFKGNGIGIFIDNRNASNSGENTSIRRCYIGNNKIDGVQAHNMQLLTFEGCSFDYNARHATINNCLTKFTNCYLETNANTTPAEMVAVTGVTWLTIDENTIIYGLPVAKHDIFTVEGTAVIDCYATVYITGPLAETVDITEPPLICYNGTSKNVFGRIKGGNGANYPRLLSKHLNLFADAEFSAGDLRYCPDSVHASVVTDVVRPGRTYAAKLDASNVATQGVLRFHKMPVTGGEWVFFMFYEKVVGTIGAIGHRLRFFTADDVQVGGYTFIGGTTFPPNFTSWPSLLSSAWSNEAHDWRIQRHAAAVPTGAVYVQPELYVLPGYSGAFHISDYYVFQ